MPNCEGAIGLFRALFITLAVVFLCKSINTNHLSHCLWVCKWIIQLHVIWWDALFATVWCCTFRSYWHNCRKGLLYLSVKFLRTLIIICSFNNLLTSHSQYHDANLPLQWMQCTIVSWLGWGSPLPNPLSQNLNFVQNHSVQKRSCWHRYRATLLCHSKFITMGGVARETKLKSFLAKLLE